MKQINSSYKLIEFLSGRRSGANTVDNVATVEFRFGAVVLIEKLVLNAAHEKIGVAGSHFGTHGHAIDLYSICPRMKNGSVLTLVQQGGVVFPSLVSNVCKSKKCLRARRPSPLGITV